jgi:hypothetical protein
MNSSVFVVGIIGIECHARCPGCCRSRVRVESRRSEVPKGCILVYMEEELPPKVDIRPVSAAMKKFDEEIDDMMGESRVGVFVGWDWKELNGKA